MKTPETTAQLEQSVIDLHNVARLLEQTIGQGQLSDDIRDCASRLSTLVRYDYTKKKES
jgi:hypothetical protein